MYLILSTIVGVCVLAAVLTACSGSAPELEMATMTEELEDGRITLTVPEGSYFEREHTNTLVFANDDESPGMFGHALLLIRSEDPDLDANDRIQTLSDNPKQYADFEHWTDEIGDRDADLMRFNRLAARDVMDKNRTEHVTLMAYIAVEGHLWVISCSSPMGADNLKDVCQNIVESLKIEPT